MIEIKNLSKNYAALKAVDGIDLTVAKGEIVGFLGPNGAGKTTTMRIITAFLQPSGGSVRVCGYDVVENALQVKKNIGYLPEVPPVYPEMKVEKYLRFVGELKDVKSKKLKSSVDKVVSVCGLENVRNRLIGNLSKGYRQRVGIAQALVHEPNILILDEPTSGLDPKQIIEIRNLIKSLAGNHTIILSTHILPEVTQTCGRVAIINEGKIVAMDHHENLSRLFGGNQGYELFVENYDDNIFNVLNSVNGIEKTQKSPSKENTVYIEAKKDFDPRSEIIKQVVSSNYNVLEFKSLKISLEDVFLKLTSEENIDNGGNA